MLVRVIRDVMPGYGRSEEVGFVQSSEPVTM